MNYKRVFNPDGSYTDHFQPLQEPELNELFPQVSVEDDDDILAVEADEEVAVEDESTE